MSEISPNNLINFYTELSNLLDAVIVNSKQRSAIDYQLLKLMHQYFIFELPDDYESKDIT